MWTPRHSETDSPPATSGSAATTGLRRRLWSPLAEAIVRRRRLASAIVAAVAALGSSAMLAQSPSRCADCHIANPNSVSTAHLAEWDASPHGRRGIGCESCHGGDPTSFELFAAHRTVLARTNPASPVHRANEPATCGACHTGAFAAFQKSRHYDLLRAGNRDVPNCATCHGEVAGLRPSPKAVEARCAQCHGPGKPWARPELPARGRLAFESLRDLQDLLADLRSAIARVDDRQRRERLEGQARLAEEPIRLATQAAHAYVYERLDERIEETRLRIGALFNQLVNRSPQ